MRCEILFAKAVIQDWRCYKDADWRSERNELVSILENNPLSGREYFEGIPAVRSLNKLFFEKAVCGFLPVSLHADLRLCAGGDKRHHSGV